MNATIIVGDLPQPACYTDEQQRLDAYAAALQVEIPESAVQVIKQETEPAPEDQDKLWIKLGSSGEPLGSFVYYDGAWVRVEPLGPPPGTVLDFFGNSSIVLTGNFVTDSALILTLDGGDATNPFWRVCDGTNGTPDLRGRVRVGAGQGTSLTNRVLNATGGAETHTLTLAESPKHTHNLPQGYEIGSPTATPKLVVDADTVVATGILPTTEAGGGDPHNNMQPFFVCYPIQRTSRVR